MPQPTVFRSIPKSDVQVTEFNAYKNWTITNTNATASGYIPLNAIFYDMRSNKRGDDNLVSIYTGLVENRDPGTPGTEYGPTSRWQLKSTEFEGEAWYPPNSQKDQASWNFPDPQAFYGIIPRNKPGGLLATNDLDPWPDNTTGTYWSPTWELAGRSTGQWWNPSVPGMNYAVGKTGYAGCYFDIPNRTHDNYSFIADGNLFYWKFAVWEHLHHMFYKYPYDPGNCLQSNQTDPNMMHKFLHYSASMVSIPQTKMGHQLKPKSIEISSTRFPFTLTDDKYGNIRIPNSYINSSSFAPNDNLVAYWGFNEQHYQSRWGYHLGERGWFGMATGRRESTTKIQSGQFTPTFTSDVSKVAFRPGINTTGEIKPSGFAANFGQFYPATNTPEAYPTYIKTVNFVGINPDHDFAWSTWIHAGTNQHTLTPADTDRDIISKYGVVREYKDVYTGPTEEAFYEQVRGTRAFRKSSRATQKAIANYWYTEAQKDPNYLKFGLAEEHVKRNRYPYRLGIYDHSHASAGHVYVRRTDGTFMVDFSSSADLRNTDAHLVLQKTGSLIELWVNGTLDNSGSDVGGNCNNNSSIMFGASNKSGSNSYSGSLDEVRYYDTALTSAQIGSLGNNHYLSGSAYQTNVVGNVFRSFGYVVTSSPMWFWNDLFTQEYDWTLKHKSSLAITEYNILVNVPKGQFNVSQNPSATQGTDSDLLLGDFTSSLRPYVSTVGLYDDIGHLLAVGKLSNPIQKRTDVDMNFVVRWDM